MVRNQQRGMTMWSAAFVIGVGAFFLFLLFKLLPPYYEDFKIRTALDGLAREPNAAALSPRELAERLQRRFIIDSVRNVKPLQDLRVQPQGRARVLRVSYEVVVPLAYNVSALLEFDHARTIQSTE